MRDPRRQMIGIDFDQTLHPMVEGTEDALRELAGRARLWVFTARRDHDLVRVMLEEDGIAQYFEGITHEKDRFDLIVDDRAIHFDGDWAPVLDAARSL